jgi:hypothetical protein
MRIAAKPGSRSIGKVLQVQSGRSMSGLAVRRQPAKSHHQQDFEIAGELPCIGRLC